MDEEAAPADGGRVERVRLFLATGILRAIDAAAAFLQRLRNRIEAPKSEETSRNGRKKGPAHDDDLATLQVVAAREHRHLSRILVFLLALLIGGISGMTYSYTLLSRSINSKEAVIDYLRDEIAQLEKEGKRNVNEMAKYQKKINENDKEILGYQDEIEDYKKQAEELRSQLSAVKGDQRSTLAQDGRGAMAATGKRPAREKTGTCVMGSTNTSANLTHCVEEFNRK